MAILANHVLKGTRPALSWVMSGVGPHFISVLVNGHDRSWKIRRGKLELLLKLEGRVEPTSRHGTVSEHYLRFFEDPLSALPIEPRIGCIEFHLSCFTRT